MIGAVDFEHEGRTYSCVVEPRGVPRAQAWWWFRVSGDTHRYAPFRAAGGDTRQSVQSRVIAYYMNHLALRSAPPAPRGPWARKQQGAAAAAKK